MIHVRKCLRGAIVDTSGVRRERAALTNQPRQCSLRDTSLLVHQRSGSRYVCQIYRLKAEVTSILTSVFNLFSSELIHSTVSTGMSRNISRAALTSPPPHLGSTGPISTSQNPQSAPTYPCVRGGRGHFTAAAKSWRRVRHIEYSGPGTIMRNEYIHVVAKRRLRQPKTGPDKFAV